MEDTTSEVIAQLRPILDRAGLKIETVDYRLLGVSGEGDACHAVVTDVRGRVLVDGWGPTVERALVMAIDLLRPASRPT